MNSERTTRSSGGDVAVVPNETAAGASSRPPSTSADLNIRVIQSLVRYVRDNLGNAELERIMNSCGVPMSSLDGQSHWVSVEQVARFAEGVRSLLPDDTAFMSAATYRLSDGYGPFRYLLWAASPTSMFALMARTMHLVSTVSTFELLESGRSYARVRYTSKKPESRLVCIARQAQNAAIPTFWGLPRAQCTEHACIAKGDAYCEYELRWQERNRWFPVLIGGAIGACCAGLIAMHIREPAVILLVMGPSLGSALAYVLELRRTQKVNLQATEEINDALRQLAREETEARRELLGFHQRQRDWTRLIEEQVGERTGTLQRVVEGIQRVREAREVTLRGFSHDLRNPLTVLKAEGELLEDFVDAMGPEGPAIVEDHRRAVDQMERLLAELMEVAATEQKLVRVSPEEMDVPAIVERIRRRIRALVHGREVRTSVFCTREAPEKISCDPLIFDRITDNMLTNAAKYTDRGSIVVELDGTEGFLVFKISDTGSGIEGERIEQIFRPKGRLGDSPKQKGYGVGLSVVVQLLDQIGGHLEVMSSPGKGTTFWAYLPVTIRESNATESQRPGEWSDNLINRVVKIRRSVAA